MVQAVALFCSFGLGVCFSLLGSLSVKLMPRLKIDQAKFGSLVTAFMSACLVASLLIGVVTDRLGYRPVAIFGFAMTAVCIFLFARAKSYGAVFFACLLFGFGAMALNVGANTLLPHVLFDGKREMAALNLGNVSFGVGLLLAPLLLSFLFRKLSYEAAVTVLAVIIAIPVVLAVLATYPVQETGAFKFSAVLSLLAKPAVVLAFLALFCYTALDASFSNWLPACGKEIIIGARPGADPGAVDASAQRLISVYAVAIMVGRLAASQIPALDKEGYSYMAAASVLVALLVAWMAWTRRPAVAWLLVFAVGLLTAPFFAAAVVGTRASTDPSLHGTAFGIIFAGALLGGATVPKAIGNLARGSSVQRSMVLLAPICAVLVVLAATLYYLPVIVKWF